MDDSKAKIEKGEAITKKFKNKKALIKPNLQCVKDNNPKKREKSDKETDEIKQPQQKKRKLCKKEQLESSNFESD